MAKKKTRREFPMDVKESAHKVWLAGLGALATAEEEGTKFFKNLVKKGEKYEDRRKEQVDKMVDKVRGGVEDVREEVESRWHQLGDSFDEKVGQAVERLGVPSREEIHQLTRRVEDLTAKLDKLQAKKGSTRKAPRKRAATKKTTTRKSA